MDEGPQRHLNIMPLGSSHPLILFQSPWVYCQVDEILLLFNVFPDHLRH